MLDQDLQLIAKLAKGHALISKLRQIIDAEQNTTERFVPLASIATQ